MATSNRLFHQFLLLYILKKKSRNQKYPEENSVILPLLISPLLHLVK